MVTKTRKRLPKSDQKREKGYQKVTEKESEWPTPFAYPFLRHVDLLRSPFSWFPMFIYAVPDTLDHDRGQKSANSGLDFLSFLQWMFVSPGSLCRKSPQNVEKIARFAGGE